MSRFLRPVEETRRIPVFMRHFLKIIGLPLVVMISHWGGTSLLAQMYFSPDVQDVTSVAWSPDGSHVLSSGHDGTIRLWPINMCGSGPFIYIDDPRIPAGEDGFRSVRRGVMSVAWSPDGKRFVAGLRDRTVRLYELDLANSWGHIFSEIEVFTEDNMGGVRAVAFSQDGAMIAAAGHDGAIRIWEAKKRGALTAELKGHGDIVESVVFTSDGTFVVSGSRDGTVRIWDIRLQKERQRLTATGPVQSIALGPDDWLLAALAQPNDRKNFAVQIWRAGNNEDAYKFGVNVPAWNLAFSPDGAHLATSGLGSDIVTIWNISSGQPEHKLTVPRKMQARGLAYSPNGKHIVTGITNGSPIVWDTESGQVVRTLGKCTELSK